VPRLEYSYISTTVYVFRVRRETKIDFILSFSLYFYWLQILHRRMCLSIESSVI